MRARIRLPRLRRSRGRILAVKWGYNPNSSSLGVDVTFLLLGLALVSLLTPLVGLFLRARRPAVVPTAPGGGGDTSAPDHAPGAPPAAARAAGAAER